MTLPPAIAATLAQLAAHGVPSLVCSPPAGPRALRANEKLSSPPAGEREPASACAAGSVGGSLRLIDHAFTLTDSSGTTHTLSIPTRLAALAAWLAARNSPAPLPLAGGWVFDPRARSCRHPAHPAIALTDKESLLLTALLAAPQGVEREALSRDIWGHEAGIDSHTLETHIYRLRQKLAGIIALTAEGSAYRLASAQ